MSQYYTNLWFQIPDAILLLTNNNHLTKKYPISFVIIGHSFIKSSNVSYCDIFCLRYSNVSNQCSMKTSIICPSLFKIAIDSKNGRNYVKQIKTIKLRIYRSVQVEQFPWLLFDFDFLLAAPFYRYSAYGDTDCTEIQISLSEFSRNMWTVIFFIFK